VRLTGKKKWLLPRKIKKSHKENLQKKDPQPRKIKDLCSASQNFPEGGPFSDWKTAGHEETKQTNNLSKAWMRPPHGCGSEVAKQLHLTDPAGQKKDGVIGEGKWTTTMGIKIIIRCPRGSTIKDVQKRCIADGTKLGRASLKGPH